MKLPHIPFPQPSRAVVIGAVVATGIFVGIAGASAVVRETYKNRILPNVSLGGIDVGGLSQGEAIAALQHAYDTMIGDGLLVEAQGTTHTIGLRVSSVDASYALLDIDVPAEVARAFGAGRGNKLTSQFSPIFYGLGLHKKNIPAQTTLREDLLTALIRDAYPDLEHPGTPTDFDITATGDGYTVDIVPATISTTIDFPVFFVTLTKDATDLHLGTQHLSTIETASNITIDNAAALIPEVEKALAAAPYTLSYTQEHRTDPFTWSIAADDLTSWLVPGRNENGDLVLILDSAAMNDLFNDMHRVIDIEAQNARFSMTNTVVSEFAPSHDGVVVNDDATLTALSDFFGTPNADILIAVDRVTPTITTENVNTLGIREVLGVGTSDFTNSPVNRIANIKHGAEKLNGLLVAPGETMSLLEKLRPFTVEDGYLPELVIKGTEIKPEVGGGLCQIGTTTFRAVMNSGLHVVERRNHSLVVSYYNDPSNNNPGTDATIYDPSPDFKFENDTALYVLLTTEVDTKNKKLYFTFWGTSDNRKASYSPPKVLGWSGYGEPQYTETDTLAPGVEKCQAAHPGATTTFTYTVNYADGTVHTEDYWSSYRSLPKICLVGKTPDIAPLEETTSETVPETLEDAPPVE